MPVGKAHRSPKLGPKISSANFGSYAPSTVRLPP